MLLYCISLCHFLLPGRLWDQGNILDLAYGGHPEQVAEATSPTRILSKYFLGPVCSQGDFLEQCARLKLLPTVVEVVRKSPRLYGSCGKWTGPEDMLG